MQKCQLLKFEDGGFQLDVRTDLENETVWLTKHEIGSLFERDRSVISRHSSNIFNEGELDENQVCAKNARTGPDGKVYQVDYYNLYVIISVSYRVKSKRGITFRRWPTTEGSSVVQIEGKRSVKRKLKIYNLDMIISAGYRVNS